eukprot:9368452-Ditylum_brightwellii.AAC.1
MKRLKVKELKEKLVKHDDNTNNTVPTTSLAEFAEGVYCKEFTPQSDHVEVLEKPFQAWASTIPEEGHEYVPLKYNFNITVQHESFSGKLKTK